MACRNEGRHIRVALDSLFAQEEVPGRRTEVIVADGMSDDGTRQFLDSFATKQPRLRVLDNPGKIVSTGLNAAIAAAQGEIVLRVDAHTEYAADYVRKCVEILESSGADNVGGPARTSAAGWLPRAIAAAYHSRFGCGGARFHDVKYEGYVETVTYGCWRKSTLERLGGFDETLVRNQDDEFNLRLVRSGGKIWQSPRIVSWYSPRQTLWGLFHQYFQYGYWKVAVIRKHRLPASWRHLVPGLFVAVNFALLLACGVLTATGHPVAGSVAATMWLLISGAYLAGAFVAAYLAAKRHGWSLLMVLPLVFAVFHVSYGLGFLLCTLRLTLWPRRALHPGRLATEITR
jgi:glycosyltransferase involved in cell wall biosynthesis